MTNTPRLLLVDDTEANLSVMQQKLAPMGYSLFLARNGQEAIEMAKAIAPDIILLDAVMPVMTGYEALYHIKNDDELHIIPVVMITSTSNNAARIQALDIGADDFMDREVDQATLSVRIKSLLKVKAYNDYMRENKKKLEQEVDFKSLKLKQALLDLKESALEITFRLTRASEYKDEDTGAHIQRVSHYSAAVARAMGWSKNEAEDMMYAAAMHDVGKIGIPDNILLKQSSLNDLEWQVMKKHTIIGEGILAGSKFDFVRTGAEIALSHHEKWDGTGYPYGKKGDKIPMSARIVAVADVFDALISKRPYKPAFTLEDSFQIIHDGKGSQFDPDIIEAFFSVTDEIIEIKDTYKDENSSLFLEMRSN